MIFSLENRLFHPILDVHFNSIFETGLYLRLTIIGTVGEGSTFENGNYIIKFVGNVITDFRTIYFNFRKIEMIRNRRLRRIMKLIMNSDKIFHYKSLCCW